MALTGDRRMVAYRAVLLRRKQRALLELSNARAQDAREQAERLDLALSGGNLGLIDLDVPTGVRRVNARAQEIIGDGPVDPVDTFAAWSERLHPDDRPSARAGKYGALLFMDLDRFKWVNDTLGHDMGDLLLGQTARRLQACVRQSDTVARLGGDEFVVVLDQLGDSPDEAQAHARRMADKILRLLREPVRLGEQAHNITGSVGITVFFDETETAEQLLKQADQALYQAKAAGRNQLVVYAPLAPVPPVAP